MILWVRTLTVKTNEQSKGSQDTAGIGALDGHSKLTMAEKLLSTDR